MKSIIDYIKQYYKDVYLESMKDIFGDELPEYIIESANKEEYEDYILETLKSHNKTLLQDKLKKQFSKKYSFYFEDYDKSSDASSFDIISYQNISKDEDFKNLIQFFGYYISKTIKLDDEYKLIISPVFTDDANKLVYVKNHGKLYHFSSGEHVNEILTKGLRCKTPKCRYYPERIYAIASHKKLNIEDGVEFAKTVVNPYNIRKYGLYIFKIDLNKLSKDSYINFYKDDLMAEEDAVYTYNNIPAECISLVKIIK